MVLEKLLSVSKAKNKFACFYVGSIVSIFSVVFAYLVFPSNIGIFSTFLITIALTPFLFDLFSYEEAKIREILKRRKTDLIERYSEIFEVYSAIFLGIIFGLTLLYFILPKPLVQQIFYNQILEIKRIRGSFLFPETFLLIFQNNTQLLFLIFIFSLLYGAGAIFVIAWNASILAVAIGLGSKSLLDLPLSILTYLPHGSLEFLAYFIASIAGSILSISLSRKHKVEIGKIFADSLSLLIFSLAILFAAAGIETILLFY